MPKPTDTTRVQVSLQTGLVEKIDELCARAHMSRSAWIEYTLALAIDSYQQMVDTLATRALNEQ